MRYKFFATLTATCLAAALTACRPHLAEAASPRAPQAFQVISATLAASPAAYNGPCPVTIRFTGRITVRGRGTVRYTFARSDGATGPVRTLTFNGGSVQTVQTTWTLSHPSFSGWQSLRILAPNPVESNRAFFRETCRPAAPPPPPRARFHITINGFTVNRETVDDALERDGKRDEVFLLSQWRLSEGGRLVGDSGLLRSRVMGDPTGRSDRVAAGSARPGFFTPGSVGGLMTGDSFPTGTPALLSGPPTADRVPMLLFDGTLGAGQVLVLFPTVWEQDGPDDILTAFSRVFNPVLDLGARAVGPAPEHPGLLGEILGSERGLGSETRVGLGIFGDPRDRPVGMVLGRDSYFFIPQRLRLTLDLADRASRFNFGLGDGVIPVRYRDSDGLQGDYTLFVQIRRL